MSNVISAEPAVTDPQQIVLPAVLDLNAAKVLQQTLATALADGTGLEIDASAVQRVMTPGLQVLAAAATSFVGRDIAFAFSACSAVFLDAARTLALQPALGIHGE